MSHPQRLPSHPDHAEEAIPPFELAAVPSDAEDVIPEGEKLPSPGPAVDGVLPLPRVMLGCATFGYGVYADTELVRSTMPVRVVRAALRAGVNAFDTAPHYHPSEIILGHALTALRDEFPRESYSVITKAGKYGAKVSQHDYTPSTVVKSVERSLARLQTNYLDVVYLHDPEFVASAPFPCPAGTHLDALGADAGKYHLVEPYIPLGHGDAAILACLQALRDLQAQGKIRRVGLAGYSLPVLLRLCRMAKAAGQPVDIVQTYAHQTILCASMEGYLPAFTDLGVKIVNAAPLSMGLLTTGGGPDWHPARKMPELFGATREAVQVAKDCGSSIEDVACAFGYRTVLQGGEPVPVVIGCTDLKQLHQTLKVYADVQRGAGDEKRDAAEKEVLALFKAKGVHNLSWQSPAPDAFD